MVRPGQCDRGMAHSVASDACRRVLASGDSFGASLWPRRRWRPDPARRSAGLRDRPAGRPLQNGALPHGDAPFRNDSPVNQTGTAEPSAPLWLWALCRTSMRQSSSSKRSCNCCRRTFSSAMRQAPSRQSPLSQRSLKFSADSVMASSRGRSAWPAPGRADRRRLCLPPSVARRPRSVRQIRSPAAIGKMLEFFGVGRRCLNTAQGIEGLHQLLALMQPAIDQLVHAPTALGHYGSFRACCPRFPLRTSRRIIVRSETHC